MAKLILLIVIFWVLRRLYLGLNRKINPQGSPAAPKKESRYSNAEAVDAEYEEVKQD